MAQSNRLVNETSLYLRQHGHNPVDWYPWGPEALNRARELDRPIFLSVGYSACHWCHVMEHECFENPEIAQLMNAGFINIKVDREERPDLDQLYMTAHQVLTREGGGWPLSVFLTPNLTPFYAGTYFPPDNRYAPHRPSFPQLLHAIADAWQTRREELTQIGEGVADFLRNMNQSERSDGDLSEELLNQAINAIKRNYDPSHGGFGYAPKFPHPLELRLLLRLAKRFDSAQARDMACFTLEAMARGGMYDQIGGGFHRYSVDQKWLVPHFEKMLYDNALLPPAYLDAFQFTGNRFYAKIAQETLDYVLREMTSPAGAFYSTQDADSEGEEGKFYVWTEAELDAILKPDLAGLAKRVFGVTPEGNFEGRSILFRSRSDEEDARRNQLSIEEFHERLGKIKCLLYGHRGQRVWPGRNEKILTAWNGLMISAFAQASAVLGERRYQDAACRAADWVLSRLRGADGRLFRTAGVDTAPKLSGYLEDYAYLADALIQLYQVTFDPRWLQEAIALTEAMIQHFADPDGGGFFFTADDHEPLIARSKDLHDGSVPSGNAMAVMVLSKLAVLTGREEFRTRAESTLRSYQERMKDQAAAAGQLLIALDFHLGPVEEIVIVGSSDSPEWSRTLSRIHRQFAPNQVFAGLDISRNDSPADIPLLVGKQPDGDIAVYRCQRGTCQAPLLGIEAVEAAFPESA